MRAQELTEYRDRIFQYIKSILPNWPDYILKEMVYPLGRGNADFRKDLNKQTILNIISDTGLSVDTKWVLNPAQLFTMDMWEPRTKERLIGRAGGKSDLGMGIPRDQERHATQLALAQQQGGVRTEPVIIIQTSNGYELLEGWHRTIQHFSMYPNGYQGPAYVARSKL